MKINGIENLFQDIADDIKNPESANGSPVVWAASTKPESIIKVRTGSFRTATGGARKLSLAVLAILLALPFRAIADVPRLSMDDCGITSVLVDDQRQVSMFLSIFGTTGGYASQLTNASDCARTGSGTSRDYSGLFPVPATADEEVGYRHTVAQLDGQSADLSYRSTFHAPDGAPDLARFQISVRLRAANFRGQHLYIQGQRSPIELPNDVVTGFLGGFQSTGFSIDLPTGAGTLTVASNTPLVSLTVQDNRFWGGDDFEVNFILHGSGSGEVLGVLAADLTVSVAPQLRVLFEPEQVVTDTSGWLKYNQPADKPNKAGSALDVSHLLDPPAGKHGKLRAVGDHFEFANRPGVPVRFFGTNVSFSACCPDRINAARIAKKLARHGFNLVRFHHLDSPGNARQIIDYAQGSSRKLNANNLRLFDYFFNQLKKRGIYAYIDLFVSRRARAGDGIENWQQINQTEQGMKGYALIDPTMIALQKEYAEKLLTHVNPYTKLAYRDDPAFVLTEIINESNLFRDKITVEPYATAFEQMWQNWLGGKDPDSETPKTGPEYKEFLADTTTAYYQDMVAFLRTEVGVTIPIAGTNQNHGAATLVSNARMDFTDSHAGWDHPTKQGTIHNKPMVLSNPLDPDPHRATVLPAAGFMQVPGRPFVLSEGRGVWPNRYRAEMPPWLTATASVQGWSGIIFHNFVNSHIPSTKLDDPFEWANNPVRYAFFPAMATMFHQGHMKPSRFRAIVRISQPYEQPIGWRVYGMGTKTAMPKYRMLTWLEGVWGVPEPDIGFDDVVLTPGQSVIDADETSATDPDRQLEHDWDRGIVLIRTEMTQGAIGFIGGRRLDLGDVTIEVETPFAVVLVTSLDERPLRQSRHMLVTAVAQAENTDQVLKNYMIKRALHWDVEEEGRSPVLSDEFKGTITLPDQSGNYRAWALKAKGQRPRTVIRLGGSTLEIGNKYRSLWYEVTLGG